jgi:hypothetical protein
VVLAGNCGIAGYTRPRTGFLARGKRAAGGLDCSATQVGTCLGEVNRYGWKLRYGWKTDERGLHWPKKGNWYLRDGPW